MVVINRLVWVILWILRLDSRERYQLKKWSYPRSRGIEVWRIILILWIKNWMILINIIIIRFRPIIILLQLIICMMIKRIISNFKINNKMITLKAFLILNKMILYKKKILRLSIWGKED